MLKILELFAGIGACSKALERLGIEHKIVDAVEIDKYAIKSFNTIHKTNFEVQDIIKWDKDIEVDLIMHGSPCQDFSIAGKQAGGDKDSGTRSSLMYETIRIVKKLKPKYVIWENVKNILSKKHRHNFESYLETMENLGYKNYYEVLNSKDYGIPQNRERVFTVSILGSEEYEFPNKIELDINLQELLEKDVEEKYFLSEKGKKYILKRVGGYVQLIYNNTKIAHCPITAKGNNNWTGNFICYNFPPKQELKLKLKDILENKVDEKYYLSGKKIYKIKNLKQKLCDYLIDNGKVKEYDIIRHSYSNSRMKEWENRNIEKNNEVPTLDTRCDCLGVVVNQEQLRIRKLTPKECWRLMGFDDEDFEKANKINSNAQLYKQAGNSIVVNVLEKILYNLFNN